MLESNQSNNEYSYRPPIISPFKFGNSSKKQEKSLEKDMDFELNNKDNNNSYRYTNRNNFINQINDDNFYNVPLSDEQKKYLLPRNTTRVNKILDFFFNW